MTTRILARHQSFIRLFASAFAKTAKYTGTEPWIMAHTPKFLSFVLLLATWVETDALTALSQTPAQLTRRLLAPAPSPSDGTDASCCALLSTINFEATLPVVVVDTKGGNVTRNATTSQICTCSHGLEKGDLNTTVGFRIRGGTNSQQRNKIYQYAVEIDDKKWFLGMPKSRKWMLYAQQLDPFGLHNWLGFYLARGTSEYAAKTQFCEVFIIDDGTPLNAETHYRGIYVAMEKPRQESNRISVANNTDPNDITGGYLAEFKHAQNPDNLPTINGTVTKKQWNLEYPKPENLTTGQLDYIQQYLNDFETALYSPTFTDQAAGWRQFANETAWVDWFLAIELIRNVKHSYHSSAFLQKDADKKLVMGPVWDNVQGFGTCCGYPVRGYESSGASAPNPASGGNGISSSGWLFSVCENGNCPILDTYAPGYGISTWFQQLWKDPAWVQACADRFAALRAGPWSDNAVTGQLSEVQQQLAPAAERTLTRWESILYQPQYYSSKAAQFGSTMQILSSFVTERLQWLDNAFKQATVAGETQGPYPSTFKDGSGLDTNPSRPTTAG